MDNGVFAQGLIEVLFSWMKLIALSVWNFFQADMAGGFLTWFADNWARIALWLIVIGLIVDWLVWMIRWRPYWLWLRKRQIVYEEVSVPERPRRAARPQPMRHMPEISAEKSDAGDFEDPFAEQQSDPYAAAGSSSSASDDFEDWDSDADPYASDPRHTEYDPSVYGRPALGEEHDEKPRRHMPVFGEEHKR